MANQDFVPNRDQELDNWATNFKNKLPGHSAALGLTDGQVTTAQTQCTQISQSVQAVEEKKNELQQFIQSKENIKKANIDELRKLIRNIKTRDGYDTDIGEDLDIIGEEEAFDPNTYKPEINAKAFSGYVRVTFTKKGVDGVNVYRKKKGEAAWKKLAFDTVSPYDDTEALANPAVPEVREYMAKGVINDIEIGEMSKSVSVNFAGETQ